MTSPRSEITILAPAKLNLGLEVLGPRDDGYHEVITVLQAIRLYDTVRIRRLDTPGISLVIDPPGLDLGPPRENLAVRAAQAVLSEWGRPEGLEILVRKRIPAGAGMGGGSSDAAAVLAGLSALLAIPASRDELACLGAGLGSDVPFFLRGGTQLATGRGETLHPMIPWPGRLAVIVFPNLSVSTSSIYSMGKWGLTHAGPLSNISCGVVSADFWITSGERLRNDLEPVVTQALPIVGELLRDFERMGSVFARVTGSGSSVFGVPPDDRTGSSWAEHFRKRGFWARMVRPSGKGCLIRF